MTDLKPENIFLVPDPVHADGLRVKILDFGIAKLRPENSVTGAAMTRAGTTMGSPAYMAPEQCYEIGQVTDRADVYALGIILYELIAGRPPFVADLPAEVIVMQAKVSPPPLSQLAPQVPAAVEALVHRLLQKAPEKRPAMTEVVAAMARLLQDKSLLTRGKSPQSAKAQTDQRVAAALGLVTALALVGTALLVRSMLSPSPPAPTRPSVLPGTTTGTSSPAKPPTAPAATTVQCEISSDPSGVQIVDAESEKVLGVTPVTLKLTRSDRPQRVVLRRAGYQDRTVLVDRSRDVVRSESLIPAPRRVRPTPPTTGIPSGTPTTAPRTSPGKDGLLAPSL